MMLSPVNDLYRGGSCAFVSGTCYKAGMTHLTKSRVPIGDVQNAYPTAECEDSR